MHSARLDSDSDPQAGRKNLRPAFTIAAGLIALAIATAAVLDPPGGPTSTGNDRADSNASSFAAISAEGRTAIANTASAVDATAPRFERSDEPALEDSTNAHGG